VSIHVLNLLITVIYTYLHANLHSNPNHIKYIINITQYLKIYNYTLTIIIIIKKNKNHVKIRDLK